MNFMVFFQQKGVGMNEKLIDEDNYPRSDIDVYTVRVARNRIICKKYIFFMQFSRNMEKHNSDDH